MVSAPQCMRLRGLVHLLARVSARRFHPIRVSAGGGGRGHGRRVTPTRVNVDNFARAETHRMMADLQRDAGGVNLFRHNREPASVDQQTVIRMNRDTLYSFAVVDVSDGATLTMPDAGDRY